MPIKVPVTQTGLEQSIQNAANKAGKNLKINMGPGAKSVEGLIQPLGRLTGKADDFTKSMSAANARVLAFGASVGVIAAVTKGFKDLVSTTIQVEKSLANINSILNQNTAQLESLKGTLFDVAKNTESTFDSVAGAALELSRQGLEAEQITKRLSDAMILSRLSGLSAADAVSGLTAAINSFSKSGITSAEVLNKISAAAASAAVSDRDLIEGLKRSGSVAVSTGVEFDQLIGIIAALQQKTARGGAVIGNSLKTIFTRISDVGKLKTLQDMGVQVTDLKGDVLSANKVIENLAPIFAKLDQTSKVNLADNLVGKFQIAPFLSLLEQYNEEIVVSNKVATISLNATGEAYERNKVLNETLSASINATVVSLKELAEKLGKIGVTDSFKNLLDFFGGMAEKISGVLDGDGIGSKLAKGLVKGISAIVTGPGLLLLAAIIAKISKDFIAFGFNSLKTFFGINKAAKEQAVLQGQIAQALLNDSSLRKEILRVENSSLSVEQKRKVQADALTGAYNAQLNVMRQMQSIAATITPSVMRGTKAARTGRAAGGFLPIGAEKSDISRGVGGAPASAKPVVIPNFAFGGGKRGTMVANSSEYIVPNYANGGDAIFNQNMASSIGLPSNARKVRAASGYIPNYVDYTIGGRRFSGAGVGAALRAGTMTPQQAAAAGYKTSAQKKAEAGKKTTKTTLNVPARIFGVASLFKGKKTADSATSPGQLTSPLATKLAQAGVKNIKFNGIQIKSLEDFKRNAKVTEKSNRTQLAKIFAGPLVKYAQGIIGKTFGNDELAAMTKEISRLGQSGGSGGARLFSASVEGGILESAMTLATKGAKGIKDFKSNSEDQIPFDFEESGLASSQFKKTFGFTNKLQKADAKRTASNDAVRTIIKKAFNDKGSQQYIRRIAKGQGFKASEGYIPNFAEGALENAIGREKAAGLPVSQIRINQSGKLRNSQNPMGLAVTNTRDEPTGAIPNFAAPTPTSPKAPRDLTGIFFAVSAGMTALQGATDGATGGMSKFTNTLSGALQTASGFAFAGAGISAAFAGATSGLGKFASKLGPIGIGIGAAVGSFKLIKGVVDEVNGKNARLAKRASEASLAIREMTLAAEAFAHAHAHQTPKEKFESQEVAKRLMGGMAPQELSDRPDSRMTINSLQGSFLGRNAIKGDILSVAALKLEEFFTDKKLQADGESQLQAYVPNKPLYTTTQKMLPDIAPYTKHTFNSQAFVDAHSMALREQAEADGRDAPPNRFFFDEESGLTREYAHREFDVDKGQSLQPKFEEVAAGFDALGYSFTQIDAMLNKFDSFLDGEELRKFTGDYKKAASESMEGATLLNKALSKKNVGKELLELTKGEKFSSVLDFSKFGGLNPLPPKMFNLKEVMGKASRAGLGSDKIMNQLNKVIDIEKQANTDKLNAEKDSARLASEKIKKQIAAAIEESKIRDIIRKKELATREIERKYDKERRTLRKEEDLQPEDRKFREGDIERRQKREIAQVNASTDNLVKVRKQLTAAFSDILLTNAGDDVAIIDSVANAIKKINAGEASDELIKLYKSFSVSGDNESALAFIEEASGKVDNLKASIDKIKSPMGVILAATRDATADTFNLLDFDFLKAGRGLFKGLGDGVDTRTDKEIFDFTKTQIASSEAAQRASIGEKTQSEFDARSRIQQLSQTPLFGEGRIEGLRRQAQITRDQNFLEVKSIERQMSLKPIGELEMAQNFAIQQNPQLGDKSKTKILQAKSIASVQELADLTKDEKKVLDEKLKTQRAGTSELQHQLQLAKDKVNEAQKELDLIDKDGPILYGFKKGFSGNIQDAETSAETLGNTLGSASSQFAYNIGSAMSQAIAQGQDLGDALIGTAIQFLDIISQAFMKNAVDSFLSPFTSNPKQGGGAITGGSGTKDDVPAILMGGEFVMNKKAVKKYGPAFMSSLNNGSIQGFSEGGKVDKLRRRRREPVGPQAMPGFQGAGAIKGMRNLMAFATQTNDPGMENMTMFGRRNSRVQKKYQGAKKQAFDLALGEMAAHKQAEEQEKARKKALMDSIKGSLISAAVSVGVSSMAKGFQAGFQGSKADGGGLGKNVLAGLKGIGVGGQMKIADGSMANVGGLKNLFTGNFSQALGGGDFKSYNEKTASATGPSATASRATGSSATSIAAPIFSSSSSDSLPDPYTGGAMQTGMVLPSMFGPKKSSAFISPYSRRGRGYATGGLIPAAGGVDTVPAMLSGGEFVMNSAATQRIGADNLTAANAGGSASGGDSAELVAKMEELITVTQESGKAGDINITINGSTGQEQNEGGQDANEKQRELSEKIKTVVKQVITDEKRLGGQLRK